MSAKALRKREKRRLRNRRDPIPAPIVTPPTTEEVWQRLIDDPNIFKTPKGNIIREQDRAGRWHYLTPADAALMGPDFIAGFDEESL